MKMFVGIKTINAVAMSLGDYNDLQGWQLPEGQDPQTEGYLVEYLDGGKANHPKFDGYISWSPKDVFEKSYKANGSLGFSEAHSIALSEDSTRIARSGWNGAELSVYYVTPENGLERHMVIRNGKTGRINTWVPSSADLTANDWSIL